MLQYSYSILAKFVTALIALVIVSGQSSTPAFTCPVKNPVSILPTDAVYNTRPNVNGAKSFMNGVVSDWTGSVEDVASPVIDGSTGNRVKIGVIAQMGEQEALQAVQSAKDAWKHGQGIWPQMSAAGRIAAIERVVAGLRERRSEIVNVLMWEIAKTADDAALEFDRTMQFIEATIAAYKTLDAANTWKTVSGIYARVRKAAIGIMLCLGPFNYPFNETYAALIPALLAGNVVIMKIPTIGGLAHVLTMEVYAQHLPPGAITFVSGLGRTTVAPMMKTGAIDVLAFIGGSAAADTIIKSHPHPHRLNLFLQLEGNNVGIVTPDADLEVAVEQAVLGSTSYNGQRCTAIKLLLVHESIADAFTVAFSKRVDGLKVGLPWEAGVQITPLAEGAKKIKWLESLIDDAVQHGATVFNRRPADAAATAAAAITGEGGREGEGEGEGEGEEGATVGGGDVHGLLMKPAVVYPVTQEMKLWNEEQFGPVIPIGRYSHPSEIIDYVSNTHFAQQAAIFTQSADGATAALVDALSTVVGRININTQCGRSPDSLPFSGRKSSALGTMSIVDALNAFSVDVVVAGKGNAVNTEVMRGLESNSNFLKEL